MNLPESVAYLPKFIGNVLKIRPPGAKISGLIFNSKVGPHEVSFDGLPAFICFTEIILSGKVTVKSGCFRISFFKYSPATLSSIAVGETNCNCTVGGNEVSLL